jgi:isochorismate hydrolase
MRTALIVIDMLNDFMDGVLGNPAAKHLVGPIASLAERVRGSQEWVVVYANDAHQLNDLELRVFPPHALAGTPGAAVVDKLRPCVDDIVVEKRFYSGFTSTDLGSRLHSQDVGGWCSSASILTAVFATRPMTPSPTATSSSCALTLRRCSSRARTNPFPFAKHGPSTT